MKLDILRFVPFFHSLKQMWKIFQLVLVLNRNPGVRIAKYIYSIYIYTVLNYSRFRLWTAFLEYAQHGHPISVCFKLQRWNTHIYKLF